MLRIFDAQGSRTEWPGLGGGEDEVRGDGLDWLGAGARREEYVEQLGLDEVEMSRIQFFAEHPELADPLIWFLPEVRHRRGGRAQ